MHLSEKEKQLLNLDKRLQQCFLCPLALTRSRALPGSGNPDARLIFIAQAPGNKEDKEGLILTGPSGRIFDELLAHAGISRKPFFITNLLKCRLPNCRKPKQKEINACICYLKEEIQIVEPEILVPLGYYSTRSVLQLYQLETHLRGSDSPNFFGRIFLQGEKKIFPLPHPTALLYNPSRKNKAKSLYSKLYYLSQICRWYTVCPMRRFYKKGLLQSSWIELYCKGDWSRCVRFQKEEQGISHPDHMLPDGTLDPTLATY